MADDDTEITRLSPTATPGKRYTFVAKEDQTVSERGEDEFTRLTVAALPGMRYSFTAKTAAEEEPAAEEPEESQGGGARIYTGPDVEPFILVNQIKRDDDELAEIMAIIIDVLEDQQWDYTWARP